MGFAVVSLFPNLPQTDLRKVRRCWQFMSSEHGAFGFVIEAAAQLAVVSIKLDHVQEFTTADHSPRWQA